MGTSGFLLIYQGYKFVLFPNNGKVIVLPTSFLLSGKASDVATPLGHFLQSDPWQSARLICLCLSWKPRRTGGCWWETECGRQWRSAALCSEEEQSAFSLLLLYREFHLQFTFIFFPLKWKWIGFTVPYSFIFIKAPKSHLKLSISPAFDKTE